MRRPDGFPVRRERTFRLRQPEEKFRLRRLQIAKRISRNLIIKLFIKRSCPCLTLPHNSAVWCSVIV
jgi:hypothetical protein